MLNTLLLQADSEIYDDQLVWLRTFTCFTEQKTNISIPTSCVFATMAVVAKTQDKKVPPAQWLDLMHCCCSIRATKSFVSEEGAGWWYKN